MTKFNYIHKRHMDLSNVIEGNLIPVGLYTDKKKKKNRRVKNIACSLHFGILLLPQGLHVGLASEDKLLYTEVTKLNITKKQRFSELVLLLHTSKLVIA